MKAAVIGIGSNSVRMLVAQVGTDGFQRLERDREGTRLFAGLGPGGRLSEDSMAHTAAAVRRMAEHARETGAEELHIFATSASRDAVNGEEFRELIQRENGVELEIVSGEEEAALSFLGASAAAPQAERCGVIDIGGGSTELVIGTPEGVETGFSCQLGAVRLFRKYPLNNRQDMAAVEEKAAEILRERMKTVPDVALPETWVGTGGTFTTLAAMVKGIPWTERTFMHGTPVTAAQVRKIGEELAEKTLEERLKLPGLQPSRADIVVHGICILLAVMRRLELDSIIVSEWGNLDGYMRRLTRQINTQASQGASFA
ncbi:MAG: Ppx/GppA family phosphatase [Clostridia bacterium]|nr:Ppx/GppA family phosphatase [Clostridia bacterium]